MCFQVTSGIGGFIHAVAKGDVVAKARLSGADINDVGIGWGDADGADSLSRFVVEHRFPGVSRIRGFPHSTGDGAEVIRLRITRNTCHCLHAAAAKRPDQPPFHLLQRAGINFLRKGAITDKREEKNRHPNLRAHVITLRDIAESQQLALESHRSRET